MILTVSVHYSRASDIVVPDYVTSSPSVQITGYRDGFGNWHAVQDLPWEAFNERAGVCRDYAHLAIALCRCMNIPARYCTGYLGDMGTPPPYSVMDFAAWFEAYLGGHWYTFDPRNNVPRIGRVLIARGRDAADVAIATTFGPAVLENFAVWADEEVAIA
jgi:transglutaminase-like putative cysteine protease